MKRYQVIFIKYSYRGSRIEQTTIVESRSKAGAKDKVASMFGILKKTIKSVKEIKWSKLIHIP